MRIWGGGVSDSITVRTASKEDADSIARVSVRTWRATYRGMLPDDFLDHFGDDIESRTQRWRARLPERGPNFTLVAASDLEGVIGFASGGPDRQDPTFREIYALYVLPACHGQGVGRRLVRAMAWALARRGAAPLRVWVLSANPSRGFYERLGGRAEGVRIRDIGGAEVEETAYQWASIDALVSSPVVNRCNR